MPTPEALAISKRITARVAQALEQEHGIDVEELDALQRFIGKPEKLGFADTPFEIGEPWAPTRGGFVTYDFFQGEGANRAGSYIAEDARVYLFASSEEIAAALAAQGKTAFLVVTVNQKRTTRYFFTEDAFVEHLAAEWAAVRDALSEGDDDEESTVRCAACGAENWELLPLKEDQDEDDEQEESRCCGKCGAVLVQVVPS